MLNKPPIRLANTGPFTETCQQNAGFAELPTTTPRSWRKRPGASSLHRWNTNSHRPWSGRYGSSCASFLFQKPKGGEGVTLKKDQESIGWCWFGILKDSEFGQMWRTRNESEMKRIWYCILYTCTFWCTEDRFHHLLIISSCSWSFFRYNTLFLPPFTAPVASTPVLFGSTCWEKPGLAQNSCKTISPPAAHLKKCEQAQDDADRCSWNKRLNGREAQCLRVAHDLFSAMPKWR